MPATVLATPDAAARWLGERLRDGATLRSDSRAVRAGDAFIAWPGHVQDGRRFVAPALAAGAAACLVEREGVEAFGFDGSDARVAAVPALKGATGLIADAVFGRPSARLQLFDVTGTNGKTSTAWWLAQALAALGRRCGVVGTLGVGEPPRIDAPVGDSGTVESTGLTTPDPVRLQAALRDFADAGVAACAIEASSIGLVEQRLAGARIAFAAFTNFTRDHLDYHGSMEAYWAAKRLLFGWPGLQAAVVNVDDPHGALLAAELREAGPALWTFGIEADARLVARGLRHARRGIAFDLVEEGGAPHAVESRLVGTHNVANLLTVAGLLRAAGVPLADVAAVLARLEAVPGRMQQVAAPGQPLVVVDYAHTPDALEKALQALRPLAAARGGALACVFGCGGNRDAGKRPRMGAIAEALADRVIVTSDNPRDENPADILAQVAAGFVHGAPRSIEGRAEAIARAVHEAAAADVLLIAGKGHEDYQEIAGVKHPFSDARHAADALAARNAA